MCVLHSRVAKSIKGPTLPKKRFISPVSAESNDPKLVRSRNVVSNIIEHDPRAFFSPIAFNRSLKTFSSLPKAHQPVYKKVYVFLRKFSRSHGPSLVITSRSLNKDNIIGHVGGMPILVSWARKMRSSRDAPSYGARNKGVFRIRWNGFECFIKINTVIQSGDELLAGVNLVDTVLKENGGVINGFRMKTVKPFLMHDFSLRLRSPQKHLYLKKEMIVATEFYPEDSFVQVGQLSGKLQNDLQSALIKLFNIIRDREKGASTYPDLFENAFYSKKTGEVILFDLDFKR